MAPLEALRFEALGGLCELYSAGPADLASAEDWVRVMHDRLTRFAPDSELSRFNAAAGRWVEVSPDFEALLRQSLDAFAASFGLVHIGVLPALLAAGYTRDFAAGQTPATGERVIAPPLPEMLGVTAGRARLRDGTAIDLGGIAKGAGPGPRNGRGPGLGFSDQVGPQRALGQKDLGLGASQQQRGLRNDLGLRAGRREHRDLCEVGVRG